MKVNRWGHFYFEGGKRGELEHFVQLQKEKAENSAKFVFLTFVFRSKIKEVRPITLEKKL